jgi:hypothetical protein
VVWEPLLYWVLRAACCARHVSLKTCGHIIIVCRLTPFLSRVSYLYSLSTSRQRLGNAGASPMLIGYDPDKRNC